MNQFDILKIFLGSGMSIWRSTHVIHILSPIADATKNGISDQMMLECGMILDVTPNTVQPVQSQFCASLQLGTGQATKTAQFSEKFHFWKIMSLSHGNNQAKSWQQVYEAMAIIMRSHGNNNAQSWQQWRYGRGLCDKLSLVRDSHKNIPTCRISLICMITFAPSTGCTVFRVIFVFDLQLQFNFQFVG